MNEKWFLCPICGLKLAKTTENAAGVKIWCRYHRGEVDIKHQTDLEQQEIINRTKRKHNIA